jgi:DNA end-binding protein Ku
MHNKQYVGALVARDGYICLLALRHPEEVLSARELPSPGGRAPDARELRMAEQLVAALEGDFHAEDFRDQYRERVLAFIKKKASGRKPRLVAVKSKKPADSLAEQLSKSLRAHEAQKRKTVA